MTVAFAPIDRTLLAAFRGSDERALEQIVRQGFPALVAAAQAESEDEASAARVVEDAFIEAWTERAKFDTPESLEVFLRQAVHRGAVRAKSRKAALHRFEAHEKVNVIPRHASGAPLTADEIWGRVNTLLHTPRPSQESTARIRADVSRHEAAAHVAKIAKREAHGSQMMTMVVVAAVVLAGIAGLVWFLQPAAGSDARLEAALTASDVRIRSTAFGQRGNIELLDGTKVALGPDTKLKIPTEFGETLRGVGLEGAASFTVTPVGEDARPFVVKAGNTRIRVTGTVFDVAAHPDQETVVVRVREGQVTVVVGEASRVLDAGGVIRVDASGQMTAPGALDAEQALAFANDEFVVVEQPLRRVVPLLNRWYDTKLNVADEKLLDRTATVRAPLTSSRQAIEAVEKTAGVRLVYQDEQRVLMDSAAAPASRRVAAPRRPRQ